MNGRGKRQRCLPGFSYEVEGCLAKQQIQETQLVVIDEVSASECPINKELIEYMLILQENFPPSL